MGGHLDIHSVCLQRRSFVSNSVWGSGKEKQAGVGIFLPDEIEFT